VLNRLVMLKEGNLLVSGKKYNIFEESMRGQCWIVRYRHKMETAITENELRAEDILCEYDLTNY